MLTYQLHDLAAEIEGNLDQPEFNKHRQLLIVLMNRLDLTANKIFAVERNAAAKRERLSK